MSTSSVWTSPLRTYRVAAVGRNSLQVEIYGTRGAIRFDLEALNELHSCLDGATSWTRELVTDPGHPSI